VPEDLLSPSDHKGGELARVIRLPSGGQVGDARVNVVPMLLPVEASRQRRPIAVRAEKAAALC
jgi:hypothetical protein